MKRRESEVNTESGVDGFYSRWSMRKQESKTAVAEKPDDETSATSDNAEAIPLPGDEEMPPLEALHEGSDYSGFLSPRVSDELRRLALRKLFHTADFNVCDGLDDYAEDFNGFEKLGDIITSDMLHQLHHQMQGTRRKQDQQTDADVDQPQAAMQAEADSPQLENDAET